MINKKHVIYRIVNPSMKIYIGQTCNFPSRMSQYKNLHCKGQKLLYRSLKKYGFENHTIDIIANATTKEEINRLEVFYITEYKSCVYNNKRYGLNILRDHTPSYSHTPRTEETLRKQRESHLGNIVSEETKNKIRHTMKGRPKPLETIAKMGVKLRKAVRQISIEGNTIKEWVSASEAARQLKISSGSIITCCKGKANHCGGYKWQYSNDKDS